MLKKYAFFIKGFMNTATLIIVFILLVTYYFYQDKIKEVSTQAIENNQKSGALFYLNGIWSKMKNTQQLQDNRTQDAIDLTSKVKRVGDKMNSYSFEVPDAWNVEIGQGNFNGQISAASKSFSERNTGGEIFYESGAKLTIQVVSGEQPSAKNPDGLHGKMLIGKENIVMGGTPLTYHKISDPRVKAGDIIDAHVLHDGNTYEIRYVYNKEKFNGGEFLFQAIMNSFKFADKK